MKVVIFLTAYSIAAFCQAPTAVSAGQSVSTTSRWKDYGKDALFSHRVAIASLMPAATQQWRNTPEEYGQGWDAYGQRVWRRFAQYELQTAMIHGSAAVMRTETQFRRCECDGGWQRAKHAMLQTVVTSTDGGRSVPNLPVIGGHIGGAMIATNWYPDRYSPWKEGARTGSIQLGSRTAINLVREFSPEIKRLFRIQR